MMIKIKTEKGMVFCMFLILISSLLISGCIEEDNSMPVSTPSPTLTPSSTPIPTPSPSPTPSPTPTPTPTPEPLFTENELPYSKSYNEQIKLVNWKDAKDPTMYELRKFLVTDKTNEYNYVYGSFMCGDFAEMVHNNAEGTGIKAGIVIVKFKNDPIKHAVNVFKTTDQGIVYVDCTGEGYESKLWKIYECIRRDIYVFGCSECSYDKLAYIRRGEEYGAISIDIVKFNTDYDYYDIYKYNAKDFNIDVEILLKEIDEYNAAMREYNEDIINFNIYWSSYPYYLPEDLYNEYSRQKGELDDRERDLSSREASINRDYENLKMREGIYGCAWESLGIVEEMEIYW